MRAEGRDGAHGWVAVSSEPDGEGEVVGALTAQWEEPDACVLLTLVVRSDARGQGVGKALLQALQQHVRARQKVLRPVGAGGGGGDGAGIKLLTGAWRGPLVGSGRSSTESAPALHSCQAVGKAARCCKHCIGISLQPNPAALC